MSSEPLTVFISTSHCGKADTIQKECRVFYFKFEFCLPPKELLWLNSGEDVFKGMYVVLI